jgi:hypothetical protein
MPNICLAATAASCTGEPMHVIETISNSLHHTKERFISRQVLHCFSDIQSDADTVLGSWTKSTECLIDFDCYVRIEMSGM